LAPRKATWPRCQKIQDFDWIWGIKDFIIAQGTAIINLNCYIFNINNIYQMGRVIAIKWNGEILIFEGTWKDASPSLVFHVNLLLH
jgi:hypothetical protein